MKKFVFSYHKTMQHKSNSKLTINEKMELRLLGNQAKQKVDLRGNMCILRSCVRA